LVIDSLDYEENMVACAVQLDKQGKAYHSGLVIGFEGEYQLFHYTGTSIDFENSFNDEDPIYCKKLDIIKDYEVINFLAICEIIENECDPKYGLVFDGSFFKDGVYYTDSGLSFITTCVGFCLFALKSFLLKTNYIHVDDWDADTGKDFRINYISIFDRTLKEIEKEQPELKDQIVKKYVKVLLQANLLRQGFIRISQ